MKRLVPVGLLTGLAAGQQPATKPQELTLESMYAPDVITGRAPFRGGQ